MKKTILAIMILLISLKVSSQESNDFNRNYPIGKNKFEIIRDRDNGYTEGQVKTDNGLVKILNFTYILKEVEQFKNDVVIVEFFLKDDTCFMMEIESSNKFINYLIETDKWVRMDKNQYQDLNRNLIMRLSQVKNPEVSATMRNMRIWEGKL